MKTSSWSILLIIAAQFFWHESFCQLSPKQTIRDLQFHRPPAQDLLQSTSLYPTFIATFGNDKIRTSTGPLWNRLSLSRFTIIVNNAQWNPYKRMINYRLNEVYANGGKIVLKVLDRKQAQQHTFSIDFPQPVDALAIVEAGGYRSPGHPIRIHLDATLDNQLYITSRSSMYPWNWRGWHMFDLHSNVHITEDKQLFLPQDAYLLTDTIWFQAISKTDPSVKSQVLKIPMDYKAPQTFDFSGVYGGDGSSASYGGDGTPGESVHLYVLATGFRGETMLHIHARSASKSLKTLIHPDGGSLLLNASGGHGGDGGNGNDGSDGSDASGTCPASAGEDGEDGADGGNGGNGGQIHIFTDQISQAYLHLVQIQNQGGIGGNGGSGGMGGDGGGDESDGTDGSSGSSGISGQDGGPPVIQILPRSQIETIIQPNVH